MPEYSVTDNPLSNLSTGSNDNMDKRRLNEQETIWSAGLAAVAAVDGTGQLELV